jgi:hypothetical protein
MSEIKQRVTNAQAIEIRDGFFKDVRVGRDYDEYGTAVETVAGELAADLLDARALIEKQAEIIRDAYTQMKQIQMYTAESQVLERIQIWGKIFIERTKEYL